MRTQAVARPKIFAERLTFVEIDLRITIEHLFGLIVTKGVKMMCTNEMRLLDMVRENDDPVGAVMTAITVFSAFLAQLQEAQELLADGQQESP